MRRKILASLIVLFSLSLGSNLLAEHFTFETNVLPGYIGTYSGNDSNSSEFAIILDNLGLTEVGKWEAGGDDTNGGWTLVEGTNGGVEIVLQWNGPGEITHIVIKAGSSFAFYALGTSLVAGDTQQIISELLNNGGQIAGVSHTTGYGGTSVPEPTTLVLLGLGLMAVPVAKKFKF